MAEQQSKSEDELDKQPPIQTWAPYIAGLIIVLAIGFYALHFHGGLSDEQAKWGEFGDFIGGLVNPIIGFFTIWLLAVSLRQNHRALSQANKALDQSHQALEESKTELELTRVAIEDARKMQEATELALKEQTAIAANARDMNNAMTLWKHYDALSKEIVGRLNAAAHDKNDNLVFKLKCESDMVITTQNRLNVILIKEANRLIEQNP